MIEDEQYVLEVMNDVMTVTPNLSRYLTKKLTFFVYGVFVKVSYFFQEKTDTCVPQATTGGQVDLEITLLFKELGKVTSVTSE